MAMSHLESLLRGLEVPNPMWWLTQQPTALYLLGNTIATQAKQAPGAIKPFKSEDSPQASEGKVRVDVEEVRLLRARLAEINQLDFDKIEWFENDEKVFVSGQQKQEWKEIGLSNTEFITR